jgi:glycosyltransferase involved in cell wall biosynthesis
VKFTFLIPSKNRLELLKFAVDSILRQEYRDFEIVVSDNASEQDYLGYINQIGDKRIVYERAATPISVTENWNRALSMASGDYVLMLGDDDALTPRFLPHVSEVVSARGRPDIVYLASYHYGYPKVIPDMPNGYLADVRNSVFFKGRTGSFVLSPEDGQAVARAAGDFRHRFGFNSQHFLFRAGFLKELSAIGGVFQGPYPDTFAATVSFLKARSIVVIPEPMVIIGISPRSFGYFYFNNRQAEGYEFLDNAGVSPEIRDTLKDVVLPGDGNNTNWLVAVVLARRALAPEIELGVNISRYRTFQMIAFLKDIHLKKIRQHSEIPAFAATLTPSERWVFGVLRARIWVANLRGLDSVARMFRSMDVKQEQFWPAQVTMIDIGKHADIGDAFNWLSQECRTSRSTS